MTFAIQTQQMTALEREPVAAIVTVLRPKSGSGNAPPGQLTLPPAANSTEASVLAIGTLSGGASSDWLSGQCHMPR
jgi:hypothetical protein